MNTLTDNTIDCIDSWLMTTDAYLQRAMETYSFAYDEALEFEGDTDAIAEYINTSVLRTKKLNDKVIEELEMVA